MAAPANSILTAGLGDVLVSEVAGMEAMLLLADRESMRNDPAFVMLPDAAGSGSAVTQQSYVGLDGYDVMTAPGEGIAATNTAFSDASATITIAGYRLQYQVSDLARSVDQYGIFDPVVFARSMVRSADMTLQNSIANVTDDFTSTVGTSGVDMSVGDWYDAQFTLVQASVSGPFLCMLHPVQYTNWQNDLRAEGGSSQWQAATAEQLTLRGPGYQGSWNGVPVFISTKVPTANAAADRAGAMWGRGGVIGREASFPPAIGIDAVIAGPVMTTFEYSGSEGLYKPVGHYQHGVSIGQDGQGVSIITDA